MLTDSPGRRNLASLLRKGSFQIIISNHCRKSLARHNPKSRPSSQGAVDTLHDPDVPPLHSRHRPSPRPSELVSLSLCWSARSSSRHLCSQNTTRHLLRLADKPPASPPGQLAEAEGTKDHRSQESNKVRQHSRAASEIWRCSAEKDTVETTSARLQTEGHPSTSVTTTKNRYRPSSDRKHSWPKYSITSSTQTERRNHSDVFSPGSIPPGRSCACAKPNGDFPRLARVRSQCFLKYAPSSYHFI